MMTAMRPEQQILELHLRGEYEAAEEMLQSTPELTRMLEDGLLYLDVIEVLVQQNVASMSRKVKAQGLSIEQQIIEYSLRGEHDAASELINSTPHLQEIKDHQNLTDQDLVERLRGFVGNSND